MSNVPAAIFRGPIVDENGMPTPAYHRWLLDTMRRTYNSLTDEGQIAQQTQIAGRTEGIGTTVQNLDAGGIVAPAGVDLSRPYVNKTFQHINGAVDLGSQVQNQLPSLNQVVNAQLNSTNFCTVDSIDNGTTATIRVYGTGGPGTSWTRQVGSASLGPYPAFSQAGLAYASGFYVMFDPETLTFAITTTYPTVLADNLIWCGTVTTVNSGGGGGTPGGGGNDGRPTGCVEVGTPVIEPEGSSHEIIPNSEWISVQFPGHSPVNMHPDTLVYTLTKVSDLHPGDMISVGKDGKWRTDFHLRRFYRASKKVSRKCPGGRYLAGTALIELHNNKIAQP